MTYNISNFVLFISFQKCSVNPGETTRLFILKPSNTAFWLSFETYLHCCCALIPNIWCDFMLQYFVQNTTGRQYIYSILRSPYTLWIKTKGKTQIVEKIKIKIYLCRTNRKSVSCNTLCYGIYSPQELFYKNYIVSRSFVQLNSYAV